MAVFDSAGPGPLDAATDYVATLLVPGQPAHTLTSAEVAGLLPPGAAPDPGGPVRCRPEGVATVLGTCRVAELAADPYAAVWGVAQEAGSPALPGNLEAEYFVWGLQGASELTGPVLVVERAQLRRGHA